MSGASGVIPQSLRKFFEDACCPATNGSLATIIGRVVICRCSKSNSFIGSLTDSTAAESWEYSRSFFEYRAARGLVR